MICERGNQMGICDYLVMDIEWNQAPGTSGIECREPVLIGIVGLDEQLNKIQTFSKGICPENTDLITEKTCKIVHKTKDVIMNANSAEVVYKKFQDSFSGYKYIVVWTRDAYELFKLGMRKNHLSMPKHRVVVLQEIIGFTAAKKNSHIGFETALTRAGIEYHTEFLHCAKHDAEYLYQLFKFLYVKYRDLTKEEGCIPNLRTGKLHTPECRYVCHKEEMPTAGKDLIFQGFTPCLCCGTEKEWRRLNWRSKTQNKSLRSLPLNEKNIEAVCRKFSMQCSISVNTVFIRTSFSTWRVFYQDNCVTKVYHENYRIKKSEYSKMKTCSEGFHKQNIRMTNFYDVVQYIYYHDKNFMKRMKKKNRIELLFEQLSG